jgi:hypothetical protein
MKLRRPGASFIGRPTNLTRGPDMHNTRYKGECLGAGTRARDIDVGQGVALVSETFSWCGADDETRTRDIDVGQGVALVSETFSWCGADDETRTRDIDVGQGVALEAQPCPGASCSCGADDETRTRDIDVGQGVALVGTICCRDGADDETRTRDIDLGKVALYQLSYIRMTRGSRRS